MLDRPFGEQRIEGQSDGAEDLLNVAAGEAMDEHTGIIHLAN